VDARAGAQLGSDVERAGVWSADFLRRGMRSQSSVILSGVSASRSEALAESKACPELAEGDPATASCYNEAAGRSHSAVYGPQ
jgi:hypothetical protein